MYKHGDIFYAMLPSFPGSSIQSGIRPVMIVSNDKNNQYSGIVQIVPLTGKSKHHLPTHVFLNGYGLDRRSIALCEQVTIADKSWLLEKIGSIDDPDVINSVQRALMVQLNMDNSIRVS